MAANNIMSPPLNSTPLSVALSTPTTPPDPYSLLTVSFVVTESLIVGCVTLLAVCVLVLLCAHRHLQHQLFHQLLASLAAATVLFSLLVRPGTIHEEVRGARLTPAYCSLYLVLLDVESILLPYTLLAATVERLVALKWPLLYARIIKTPSRLAVIIIPWAVGLFFGIIRNFAMNEDIASDKVRGALSSSDSHHASVGCYVVTNRSARHLQVLLNQLVANILPAMALAVSSAALVVAFCKKSRRGGGRQGNANVTDLDVPVVHSGSVVLVVVVDIAMLLVVIDDAVQISRLGPWVVTHWLYSGVEMLLLILAVTLLPDVRGATSRVCCCYDVRDSYRPLINVNSATQTISDDD